MPSNGPGSQGVLVSITPPARDKLLDYRALVNNPDMVPAIVWSRMSGQKEWALSFGFYYRADIPAISIQRVDDLELLVVVPDDVVDGLARKEVDYDGGKFILR